MTRPSPCHALLLFLGALTIAATHGASLKLTQTIPLPDVNGRIDHFAADVPGQRLFVSALGNNSVEVIDLRKGQRTQSISGLGSPQGAAYVPSAGKLYVANDRGGRLNIYDGKSFHELGTVNFEDDADNVRSDESDSQIFVGFGSGGLGIINVSSGKKVSAVKLPGHPESFQLEHHGPRVFVNIPSARQVAVVDRMKGAVIGTWSLDTFANYPMALDEDHHRLFIGCRSPARLLVLDAESGKTVARLGIGGDTDDVFYDAKHRCLYVVCGAGEVDIINQGDANTYTSAGRIQTAPGARTGLFVHELGSLFVAVPRRGNQNAEIRRYQVQ